MDCLRFLRSLLYRDFCFRRAQVGYGDISARTKAEMIMSVVAEMLGGMIFGILVGVVGTSITAGRMADQKYREQMENQQRAET